MQLYDLAHDHTSEAPEDGSLAGWREEVRGHVVSAQVVDFQVFAVQELLDIEILDIDMSSLWSGGSSTHVCHSNSGSVVLKDRSGTLRVS